MDAEALHRLRATLTLICCLFGAPLLGDYLRWWPLGGDARGALAIIVAAAGICAVIASDWLDKVRDREHREREEATQRKKEADRREQEAKDAELLVYRANREKMIAGAQKIAKADYPGHIDDESLIDRGWSDEHIDMYLDPPDVILKYYDPGGELRLYERSRAVSLETSNYEVRQEITRTLRSRREDAEAERQRKEVEEAEAREIAEREQRLANQQVIDITGKLRDRS